MNTSISIVIGGDGVFGEGIVYETLNMASLLSLPLLFIIENNGWAQSTSIKNNLAGTLLNRFQAFGIHSHQFHDNSPLQAYSAIVDASNYVRTKRAPAAVILDTYRLCHHSKNDDNRPADEVSEAWLNDPLKKLSSCVDHEKAKEHEALIVEFLDSFMISKK